MEKKTVCPCPNLKCPNHGDCENCSSRHLRIGSLNYCAFYAILPELEAAVKADPDSPAAKIIQNRIDQQMKAYAKRMYENNLTENSQRALRLKKSKLSNH